MLKSGDRVALIYPNNDPINFMCAFYGCLQAGMVPVPIEVPITRRVCVRYPALLLTFFMNSNHFFVTLWSHICSNVTTRMLALSRLASFLAAVAFKLH